MLLTNLVRAAAYWSRLVLCHALIACLGGVALSRAADLPLSAPESWEIQEALVEGELDDFSISMPVNYKVGRATSATFPAKPGELFTVAAEVRTTYASAQGEYYEAWLEIEFVAKGKVVGTHPTPKLVGPQADPQALAVTAAAPKNADAVRAVVCAVNKKWHHVENAARLTEFRLMKLKGAPGGPFELELIEPLANEAGERTAQLQATSDWPDGTAIRIETSRGLAPPSALIEKGKAQVAIRYPAKEVGSTEATLRTLDEQTTLKIPDPRAASLTIQRVLTDGVETPVRIRLTREKEMLPGRYQEATPGIFASPPWSIELAPGTWNLRVSRGPQFRSFQRTIEVESGKTLDLAEIELQRLVDLPALGWYGGDADGDVYHGELIYQDVNADTAVEIAQAMGLDWVGVGRWGVRDVGGPHPKTWGEADQFMKSRSRDGFLFVWTDERPKGNEGHACLIGLARPAADRFEWGWTNAKEPLRNFQTLQMIRATGAATFANHPLRWWMTGGRFRTNLYASLPFDLCAAGLLDGVNVNDKPQNLELWSMLLDHGYRPAATAGADFGLDRPGGPVPGAHRMYCLCPDGLSSHALAEAVRHGRTVVSTGPTLIADIDGQPPGTTVSPGKTYRLRARAWAAGDEDDPLRRLELWSHGRAIDVKTYDRGASDAETVFDWQPKGDWDWVAVRAVSLRGFAITSAFYGKAPEHQSPSPVDCRLTIQVEGVAKKDLAGGKLEIWAGAPSVTGSELISSQDLKNSETLTVPASATLVVQLADGRRKQTTVYEASGVAELVDGIIAGERRHEPLLDWTTYEETLERCRQATARIEF